QLRHQPQGRGSRSEHEEQQGGGAALDIEHERPGRRANQKPGESAQISRQNRKQAIAPRDHWRGSQSVCSREKASSASMMAADICASSFALSITGAKSPISDAVTL